VELQWFIAAFGVFEGALLTLYGIFLVVSMQLTFFQVSLSTIFASTFLVAYVLAFLLRSRQRHFLTQRVTRKIENDYEP